MYICICSDVTEEELLEYLKNNPDLEIEDVMFNIGVSMGCGKCFLELEQIFEEKILDTR